MNQLDLVVGGKSFTIACEPGEEEDVRALCVQINAKFQQLAPRYEQNLLFAALMLADDLQSAQTGHESARSEQLTMAKEMEGLRREIETSAGQHEHLRQTIADREQEFAALKSDKEEAAQANSHLIEENERLKHVAHSAEQEKARLLAEISSLKDENRALDERLVDARQAPAAASAQASFIEAGMATNDPQLAPALERFAELLEKCAIKLEGGLESEHPAS